MCGPGAWCAGLVAVLIGSPVSVASAGWGWRRLLRVGLVVGQRPPLTRRMEPVV